VGDADDGGGGDGVATVGEGAVTTDCSSSLKRE
jgi:hypothetical protein